ncbi:ShlB/FhaC/HecB family hemolysin secretion/activation protein [Acidocella sp.]|uniref:ShlB/FhaC/HecB family hemolysin secretion/activation protein n=1 Tax=Acidocella sp. TaxID=50710 RepID=UPI00261A76AA|nr:ShlB/FhaC/HecB family hemolysin secretion/activation protein [Acidocella sp.]
MRQPGRFVSRLYYAWGFNARAVCYGAMLAVCAGPALAQSAPPNPLLTSPLPHIQPAPQPQLGAGLPNFETPGAEGTLPNAAIAVRSVTVVGATAFAPARLAVLTRGLAGQTVALQRIEAARLALLGLYRGHGFILTTVSLDIDAAGNVRFIVIEGRIVAVKLSQSIGPAGTMVLRFLNHLTAERPLNEASLERWLLLAQQIPGIAVHAVLQADSDDPGALTLVAEVSKQDVSGLLTADNRGFKDAGPVEALAVADLNSMTAQGDQTEVSLFHTEVGTDNFGQVSESFFIGDRGLRLKLYGGAGRANPRGTLGAVHYESFITVFGGVLSYPLLLQRNQALDLSLHFDGIEDTIHIAGIRNSADSLRVARFAGQYAWQDLWAGNGREAQSVLNLQDSQGVPAFGASPDGRTAPPAGRADAKMDFWKLTGSVSRTQTLFSPFGAATVALRAEAGGQYTTDILPSEEQFYLGGSRFTRGYYSGQVVGDKAAYATAELQLNTGDEFTLFHQDIALGAQFYGFYDWGETWSNLKTDLNHQVRSAGGGVRLGLTKNLEMDGEVVERLTTQLEPKVTGTAPLSETVIYWGVTARY